jgi:hypothetical protein
MTETSAVLSLAAMEYGIRICGVTKTKILNKDFLEISFSGKNILGFKKLLFRFFSLFREEEYILESGERVIVLLLEKE